MIQLSIVIPCYNEGQNLSLLLKQAHHLLQQRHDLEFILVNNGSTDQSVEWLEPVAHERLKVISISTNHGYGYGILVGLSQAQGDVLGWTHADLVHGLEDALQLFDYFQQAKKSNIILKGQRQCRGLFETFYAWIVQGLCRLLIHQKLHDIRCQPKLFSREFYEDHLKRKAPQDFTLDLYLLYQANKCHYQIIEQPVNYQPRQHGLAKGVGHWRTGIRQLKKTFLYLLRLKNHTS
ncbi:MAG: glycosyltransferase [Legionellales bacterium]|nr:glycosyltransferase [Legionellales bacterium]